MGEISRALEELRTKCTTEGTLPTGNSVADILEYIAENYKGGGSGSELPDIALKRIANYLYEVSFNTLPEAPEDLELNIGACSSYVSNGKLYRNLDWKYSETAEFVVTTKKFKGMAYIDGLNDSNLDREKINKLPYRIVDGVNESGIMVSTHVLYNDWEYAGSGEKNINILQIPFLILNNITTLTDFDDQMSEYLSNIKIPNSLAEMDYLLHFLVSDGSTTYVIEPPESQDGNYTVIDATNNPKLTNFRWVDRAEVDRTDEDMQTRPTGIERFNAMPCDMASIKFTNAYESPDWLSEFIGEADTTKDSTDEELLEVYNTAREIYLERERNGETWQTMHSVVYSPTGMEHLYVQENFDVDLIGGGGDSGLPDPSDLPNGTALVSVNGEWTLQDGYGYTEGGRVNLLTQDEVEVEFVNIASILYQATEWVSYLTPGAMAILNDIADGGQTEFNSVVVFIDDVEYVLTSQTMIVPDPEGELAINTLATEDWSITDARGTLAIAEGLVSFNPSFEGTHTVSMYASSKVTHPISPELIPTDSEGSGLPNPSNYHDGTVMVAYDGEWYHQDGYGYKKEVERINLLTQDEVVITFEKPEWNQSLVFCDDIENYYTPDSDSYLNNKIEKLIVTIDRQDYELFNFSGEYSGLFFATGDLDKEKQEALLTWDGYLSSTNIKFLGTHTCKIYGVISEHIPFEKGYMPFSDLAVVDETYSVDDGSFDADIYIPIRLKERKYHNNYDIKSARISNGITIIGEHAFYDCNNLQSISLPTELRHIEQLAFYDCRNLELTELPEKLTSIGDYAFSGCTNLALTELPSRTDINDGAFRGCTNLALTELPAGLTSIKYEAFSDCTNLALTELPAGLTKIKSKAFSGCANLALTELPSGITEINSGAFRDCTNLALTELPAGVVSIGEKSVEDIDVKLGVFENCTSLTTITFNGTPSTIESRTFQGCTSLTDIYVPWSEGEVSGAPWGATNATIHYDYTPTE